MNKAKTLFLVLIGNILEYYDFLLFAHIGPFITPLFIPESYKSQSDLFALFAFALPFVVRPIGGYFFGRIADTVSTNKALDSTLFYAGAASFLLGVLPDHSSMGYFSTMLFLLFRSLQGFALGGEYGIAGTLLMDRFSENRHLVSGVLGASGTVGSLIAFLFSLLYITFFRNTDTWRLFFLFGGIATYYSAYLRKRKMPVIPKRAVSHANRINKIKKSAIYKTLALGAVTSVSCFIPMIYSHFYLTKVLNMSQSQGLMATFIALVGYGVLTPLVGHLHDRIPLKHPIAHSFVVAIPFAFLGWKLIEHGNLIGQIPLTLAASLSGASLHVMMNRLFPLHSRSRYVNVYFSVGASLGGLLPALSGYLSKHYEFDKTPLLSLVLLLILNAILFAKSSKS
jgi:MFS transporter, MHS family, proline/betaine transporter